MSLANPITAPAGGHKAECWKRKGSEEDDDNLVSNAKRAKYSWHVILASESPQATSSDEDDESIHSVQGVETEFAHDTEDTSTSTWVSTSHHADVSIHEEYDPVSLSEDENPFIDDSSSDPEELLRVGMIAAIAAYDSDLGLADDSDDSRTSRDSEISLADYWTCFHCNTSNNNPKFRFCDKCYTERKNHLPLRPKENKRRDKSSKLAATQSQSVKSQELTTFDSGLGSSQGSQPSLSFVLKSIDLERNSQSQSPVEHELLTFDSGLGSSQGSQSTLCADFKRIETGGTSQMSMSCSQESVDTVDASFSNSQTSTNHQSLPSTQEIPTVESRGFEILISDKTSVEAELPRPPSQESAQSIASTVSVGSKDLNNSGSSDDSGTIRKSVGSAKRKAAPYRKDQKDRPRHDLCLTCADEPANGIFVHGRTTHVTCCYRCAKRVWKERKNCPTCNRRIRDVLRLYYG